MLLKEVVKQIKARQIFTSRSTPTVEVEFCMDGFSIFSSVPAGKSTGEFEAKVIIDGGIEYDGYSVNVVVKKILEHSKMILNSEICCSDIFDSFLISLDGTKDKSKLGANFILPLSICFRKLIAYIKREPVYIQFLNSYKENIKPANESKSLLKDNKIRIPIAHFNIINGGLHSINGLDCQEIMVCFERNTFKEQIKASITFYKTLKNILFDSYDNISMGDEGGFCPPFKNITEALNLIMETARKSKINNFKIALDLAANSYYKGNRKYVFDNKAYNGQELALLYENLIDSFPIYSVEDPFAENDYASWEYFFMKMNKKINIVADDLTVTNPELISKYKNMFNTVLIKPNQIGSIVETINAVNLCKSLNYKIMISHRSAETEDNFISNLAVGVQAEYIKAGAPCRGERISKYNELIRIEENIETMGTE